MDCEKFDTVVIDALYDELDELTYAAMKRHMESCSRCAGAFSGLRATREVGILPIEEPSDNLEDRILRAADAAQKKAPWPKKVIRGIAWAGSHAMRPQLAMAAVLVLILGSSVLLLRAKPGTLGVAPVRVTEHGRPEPEPVEAVATAAPAATAMADESIAAAEPKRGADKAEGDKPKDAADDLRKGGKDPAGASDALAAAKATEERSGCEAAAPEFDRVGASFPGTPSGHAAMAAAGRCYLSMGQKEKAREAYTALKDVDGYRDEANRELQLESGSIANNMNPSQQAAGAGAPAAAAVAAPAPMPAPPAAPAKQAAAERQSASESPPAGAPPAATASPTTGGGNASQARAKPKAAPGGAGQKAAAPDRLNDAYSTVR